MSDLRTEKVKNLCSKYFEFGCDKCPLGDACQMKWNDTRETWAERMNKKAESVQ